MPEDGLVECLQVPERIDRRLVATNGPCGEVEVPRGEQTPAELARARDQLIRDTERSLKEAGRDGRGEAGTATPYHDDVALA